jgi:hypothetical protein
MAFESLMNIHMNELELINKVALEIQQNFDHHMKYYYYIQLERGPEGKTSAICEVRDFTTEAERHWFYMSDRFGTVFFEVNPGASSVVLEVRSVRSIGDIFIKRDSIDDSDVKKENRNVIPLTQEDVKAGMAELIGIFDDSFPGPIGSA